MQPMTVRERFHACMNFQPVDRLPMIEWAGWWDKTVERWQNEGLPVTDRYEMYRYFGLDMHYQFGLSHRGPECPRPASHGAGILTNAADYERILPHLYYEPEFNMELLEKAVAEQERGEAVIWITIRGFFWYPRELFGIEKHLYAFYDQPELMHRMNRDLAEWIQKAIAKVRQYCNPDFITFAEDMSYNHGSMLSKELFDEFMMPYYRQVLPGLKDGGTLIIVDSDGDITVPTAWFQEAGIQGMLPLERQSGVDIHTMRDRYPEMRFIGHFDKLTMTRGEEAMRAEFERLMPAMRRGGFIPSVDHQTPPGVSLAQYQTYLELFREYTQKAASS